MSAGEFNHLRHFCFRHFVGEYPADTHTVAVDLQHDLHGLVAAFVEESLEDMHDEFHRRVVVVEQKHLVEAGLLRLRPCFRNHAGADAIADAIVLARLAVIALFVCHRRSFVRATLRYASLPLA